MKAFGICYFVGAPVTSGGAGTALVYGTPFQIEGLRQADLKIDRADEKTHGDNVLQDYDNGVYGGMFTMSATGVDQEKEASLLGLTLEGVYPNQYYDHTDDGTPALGCGYIRNIKKQNGTKVWVAHWLHKVYLAKSEIKGATKAGAITFDMPVYEGPLCGVDLDGTGKERFFRNPVEFSSYAAAKTYLDNAAGLPVDTVATPTADPVAGEVASGTEITLATGTSGATIYYTTDGSTPTSGSMVYNSEAKPKVFEAGTIKAIAVKAGMLDSAVLSAPYTISA